MASEQAVAIYILTSGAAIVAGASTLPPLTAPGGASQPFQTVEEDTESNAAQELSYCRNDPEGANCLCFATVSGHIMAVEEHRIRGYQYADKTALARNQAKRTC